MIFVQCRDISIQKSQVPLEKKAKASPSTSGEAVVIKLMCGTHSMWVVLLSRLIGKFYWQKYFFGTVEHKQRSLNSIIQCYTCLVQ